MKTIKITYWITTAIVALVMVYAAYGYLTAAELKQAFHQLGLPNYFRVELAIAKLLGAVVLLVPFSARIKEWAYVGFAITLISALIAHLASGDPLASCIGPFVFLVLLAVSYLTYHKLQAGLHINTLTAASKQAAILK